MEEKEEILYHRWPFDENDYDADILSDAYSIECGDMSEDEFVDKHPDIDPYRYIKHFEDDAYRVAINSPISEYRKVADIDYKKDGVYVTDMDNCLYNVILGGRCLLSYD